MVSLRYYFYVCQVPTQGFRGLLGPNIKLPCTTWFVLGLKHVLWYFTAKSRPSPGHSMSKSSASQFINTAKARAPTLLSYVVHKYRTYLLITVSSLLQHTPEVKTEAISY